MFGVTFIALLDHTIFADRLNPLDDRHQFLFLASKTTAFLEVPWHGKLLPSLHSFSGRHPASSKRTSQAHEKWILNSRLDRRHLQRLRLHQGGDRYLGLSCLPFDAYANRIHTDVSNFAVGAVLQQFINEEWCPLMSFSKRLKYSAYGRELLTINLSINHFRYLIEGREFHLFTDHKPLTYAIPVHTTKYFVRHVIW